MLKDVKKTSEMEVEFKKNPTMILDYAYEAVSTGFVLTEPMIEVFERSVSYLEKVPAGELLKKMEMFLELDIFTSHFEVLDGLKIWKVIQHYSDEAVKQSRIIQ